MMFMKEKSRTFSNVLRQVLVFSGFRVFVSSLFVFFFKVTLIHLSPSVCFSIFFLAFRQIK